MSTINLSPPSSDRALITLPEQQHSRLLEDCEYERARRDQYLASPHFTSMPPIERRSMVPKQFEYISLGGLWRSLVACLRGKTAPAELSLGRIPGK